MARAWQVAVIRCAQCGGILNAEEWIATYGGRDYHPACVGFPKAVTKMAEQQAGRRAGRPISGKGKRRNG